MADDKIEPGIPLGAPLGYSALGHTTDVEWNWLRATDDPDTAEFHGLVEEVLPPKPPVRPPVIRPPVLRQPGIIEYRGVDIRLVQDPRFPDQGVVIDWSLRADGTLDDTQALATAIIVALGTDHRADAGEELPDPDSTERGGWWGDYDVEAIWDGWPIGSKLWLLRRESLTSEQAYRGSILVRTEQYIREAIQPFIARRIGSRMNVDVTKHGKDRLDVLLRIYRGPVTEIELRYAVLWTDIAATGEEYNLGGEAGRSGDYW